MLKNGIFLQNRYEIISCIGSGGMADVYKAKDHKLNRFVAVKVLKQEFRDDATFLSKFRVEAQAAAGLSHANIVNVYDVGEEGPINFIVMELVEGITLKAYIGKKGKLSVREATSIALQVCAGLAAAHNNNIIHRDVKPQNILISMDGKAKIADFGIARAATSNTINSTAIGSVHYCAPEQSRGGYSDAKSDIYSLGITLYEMVTGRVPFDGDSTVEIALRHLQDEIPSPKKFTPELPFSTEQIILKCTQKSPDRRYQSVEELIRDLKESLVNPGGNFVVIPQVDRKAQTVKLTEQEMRQLKNSSLPSYDRNINTGAVSSITGAVPGANPVSGDIRNDGYSGSYYQSSGYQNMRHNARTSSEGDLTYSEYDRPDPFDDEEELEETTGTRRRRRRNDNDHGGERIITVIGIIAAVIAGLVILAFVGRTLGLFGGQGRTPQPSTNTNTVSDGASTVTVPDLIGKTEEEARELLKTNSLVPEFLSETPSSEYEKGLVASQTVPPGTGVEKNTQVGYELSSGSSQTLTVPDLENKTAEEAAEALSNLGLTAETESFYSNTIDLGNVITTNPGAGSVVNAGSTVKIYVSLGQDTSQVRVPEVVGHYVSDAQTMLTNLGLYCYVNNVNDDNVEADIVIDQDVAPDTPVASGTAVTLTVSMGPEKDVNVDVEDPEGTWMCNAQLQPPADYNGQPVRIQLVQGEYTKTLFEGNTDFPYFLNVEGQPGVGIGTVNVYTLDPQSWEPVQTTVYENIEFTRVD